MPPLVVTLWLVLYLPGQNPIPYTAPVTMGLDECLEAERYFLTRPTDSVLLHGGRLEASCVIEVAPTEEH